jgi:dimethylaniline monooxygenase (N-oxide forming)
LKTANAAINKVCIVGAGSSGLTAAKTLHQLGIDFDCFERGSGIGGNWRYLNDNGTSAAYASLHINTSKQKMAFSDFPMPDSFPDYPHHSQVLEYFESYVDHFGFRGKIIFKTTIAKIEKADAEGHPGAWRVTLENGESHLYAAVLVANGHHWSKRLPSFPGHFAGRTLHAHDYRTFAGLEDKNVLIVGIGNSAVDLACEVCRVAANTLLSTRRSAYILPKYAFGKPIDHFQSRSSAWVPLWVQQAFFKLVLKTTRGNQAGLGIPLPAHGLMQAHPTVSEELPSLVGHGRVLMRPDIDRLDGDGVVFKDGRRDPVDVIIYCTGYHIDFPFLPPGLIETEKNRVRLYRHVVHPEHQGLYFIGLVQPLGAVMPLAEAQAKWVANLILGKARLPSRAAMEAEIEKDLAKMRARYVSSDRHTIQVDFFPYLIQVEREARRN